jgi:hypothetical protein
MFLRFYQVKRLPSYREWECSEARRINPVGIESCDGVFRGVRIDRRQLMEIC